jgi:hypothetical protein
MELEFLKIDMCATNIKEKILQNLTMYPTWTAMCRIKATHTSNIYLKYVTSYIDVISSYVDMIYNRAKGCKEIIKKCIKIIVKKNGHIAKQTQFINSVKDNLEGISQEQKAGIKEDLEKNNKEISTIIDSINRSTKNQTTIRNNIADAYEMINKSIYNFKQSIKNSDFVYNKKYVVAQNKKLTTDIKNNLIDEVKAIIDQSTDTYRKIENKVSQNNIDNKYNEIFTEPMNQQNARIDEYINEIRKSIDAGIKKLKNSYTDYLIYVEEIIKYSVSFAVMEIHVNIIRYMIENPTAKLENMESFESLFQFADKNTEKNLEYRIQDLNINNNTIVTFLHKYEHIINKIDELEKSVIDLNPKFIESLTIDNQTTELFVVDIFRKNIDKLFKRGDVNIQTYLMRLYKYHNNLRNDKIDKMAKTSRNINKMNNEYLIYNNACYNLSNSYKAITNLNNKAFLSFVHGLLKTMILIDGCYEVYKEEHSKSEELKNLYMKDIKIVYNYLLPDEGPTKTLDLKTLYNFYNDSKSDITKCTEKIKFKLSEILDVAKQLMKKIDISIDIPEKDIDKMITEWIANHIIDTL